VRRSSKVGFAIASTFLVVVVALAALPLLAPVGENDLQRLGAAACGGAGPGGRADDGTPTILGPPSLTVADLSAWWRSTGRGQPPRLGLPVDDLIALYVSEGDVEGVRGDRAFAQAVHETGYFTSLDTTLNNFAGISHADGALLGRPFADLAVGVRAHIQLLKKYAAGNDVDLARPDIAPDAGARATTWGQLAGTWASDPDYWWRLSAVFESMLDNADPTGDTSAIGTPRCPDTRPDDIQTSTVRGITVHVVDRDTGRPVLLECEGAEPQLPSRPSSTRSWPPLSATGSTSPARATAATSARSSFAGNTAARRSTRSTRCPPRNARHRPPGLAIPCTSRAWRSTSRATARSSTAAPAPASHG
jgi:hypothetical protein